MSSTLSASRAAKMAGCAPSTMRRWLKEERIEGARLDSKGWAVPEDSVRKFLGASAPQTAQSRIEREARASSEIEKLLREQLEAARDQLSYERERAAKAVMPIATGVVACSEPPATITSASP